MQQQKNYIIKELLNQLLEWIISNIVQQGRRYAVSTFVFWWGRTDTDWFTRFVNVSMVTWYSNYIELVQVSTPRT
jgi:hypothetical protein